MSSHRQYSGHPPLDPDTKKALAIRLSTGHIAIVRGADIRIGYPNHTVHHVLFFENEAELIAGNVLIGEVFEKQWNAPHPDPGSEMLRILEHHCQTADRHQWKQSGYVPLTHSLRPRIVGRDSGIPDALGPPDTHGILTHPTMTRFYPVEWL